MRVPGVERRAVRARRIAAALVALAGAIGAGDLRARETDAARGRELLLTRAYLPADLDQEVFDELWTTWEEPARSRAAAADVAGRRRMAMERYGLTPHPDDPSRSLQYVVDAGGRWSMSCLACHQGEVRGRSIPGVPNTLYALETLTAEASLVKVRRRKAFGTMDVAALLMPLGTTNGTTNAVIFGVALMQHRDADLAIVQRPPRFDLVHHDMDAPAWWHYRRRRSLYADGFAPKGHRMLMQFLLVKENGPERFAAWEDEFRDIEAWIESLEPPPWPGAIDRDLAARGGVLFADHCAGCHGTHGAKGLHPDRVVPIAEVGTDRVRLDGLFAADRRALTRSWFGHHGADARGLEDREAGRGYVAPPLDGVWATAPYFHNGSVPTLWHVLHPAERPTAWQRSPAAYDEVRVGLEVVARDAPPDGKLAPAERRRWFDTRKPGKGAGGHDFPDALSEPEKDAVLEYLKTL